MKDKKNNIKQTQFHSLLSMGQQLQTYISTWKKLLLDLSKRNRLINFTEGN